ncbi:MAG: hypothetical protein HFJ35_04715 [Clostridia bacterium]|nr:hypothetical protein [Clostridia bacterium]
MRKKEYSVIIPEFSSQKNVIYDKWKVILDKYKREIKTETILIAHSIGNEFIIKYLTENNIKVKMYISLAGFAERFEREEKEDLNRAIKEFLVSEKEIEIFRKLISKKYSIYSDNDHIVPFEVLENYPQIIGAKPILIKGIGHMGKKSGLETIPEVVKLIDINN